MIKILLYKDQLIKKILSLFHTLIKQRMLFKTLNKLNIRHHKKKNQLQ